MNGDAVAGNIFPPFTPLHSTHTLPPFPFIPPSIPPFPFIPHRPPYTAAQGSESVCRGRALRALCAGRALRAGGRARRREERRVKGRAGRAGGRALRAPLPFSPRQAAWAADMGGGRGVGYRCVRRPVSQCGRVCVCRLALVCVTPSHARCTPTV